MGCQHKLPGRTYMPQMAIPQLYNSMKDDMLKEIKDIPFYSATTDMWSSSKMTPFLVVFGFYPSEVLETESPFYLLLLTFSFRF